MKIPQIIPILIHPDQDFMTLFSAFEFSAPAEKLSWRLLDVIIMFPVTGRGFEFSNLLVHYALAGAIRGVFKNYCRGGGRFWASSGQDDRSQSKEAVS